jgi:RimJ/RimL family protein N-acetyltransferase
VGLVQATVRDDHTAFLAYQVFPPYWRRGFAREACARVIEHLAADHNTRTVEALIDTRNRASIGLAEQLGMTLVETIEGADLFKGARSDEFRYRLELEAIIPG